MVKILDDIFLETLNGYEVKHLGDAIYIELDKNRRIELSFYNTHAAESYDSLKLRLLHKENGELHSKTVKFEKMFQTMQDLSHPNKIGKHIWRNNGKYSWYGKPTAEDVLQMQQTLLTYIEIWK